MALIARSIEMSFSLSRPRRTLRSMSILAPVSRPGAVKPPPGAGLGRPAELDLHLARAQFGVAELPAVTCDVQRHGRVASREHPALYRRCTGPRAAVRRQRRAHQPAPGPAPVPRLGEWPVHARG